MTAFEVVPAGGFARALPLLLGGLMVLGAVPMIVILHEQPRVLLAALPAVFLGVAVAALFAWAIRNPRLRLRDGVLEVGRLPRLRQAVGGFDLDRARIVELGNQRDLQPTFRLLGTSLPGFRHGWFRLRDRSRAFPLVTDARRVLVLPRRAGGPVLLSAARPEALLDALRRSSR